MFLLQVEDLLVPSTYLMVRLHSVIHQVKVFPAGSVWHGLIKWDGRITGGICCGWLMTLSTLMQVYSGSGSMGDNDDYGHHTHTPPHTPTHNYSSRYVSWLAGMSHVVVGYRSLLER